MLGQALARRAGTDYDTLLRARGTGPLGLSRASTVGALLGRDVAVSHNSDLHPTDRLAMGALAPAGAMLSSANDLLTFLAPASPPFTVLRDGERLFIGVPYMAKLPLRAESEHDFFVPELQWEFVFDWDALGHVKEMLLVCP